MATCMRQRNQESNSEPTTNSSDHFRFGVSRCNAVSCACSKCSNSRDFAKMPKETSQLTNSRRRHRRSFNWTSYVFSSDNRSTSACTELLEDTEGSLITEKFGLNPEDYDYVIYTDESPAYEDLMGLNANKVRTAEIGAKRGNKHSCAPIGGHVQRVCKHFGASLEKCVALVVCEPGQIGLYIILLVVCCVVCCFFSQFL